MNFSEDNLKLIEECARCLMTLEEVAIILEVKKEYILKEFNNKESELYKKYTRGKYLSELEVRKRIIELAVQGSSQAQELWMRLRTELKIAEA